MADRPPFETHRLASYLSPHLSLPEQPLEVARVGHGYSNPTFVLRSDGQDLPYILRKQPDGILPKSAHAIDREFRVMKALAATDVPVPAMLHFCEDPSVIGTPFFIMERIIGRVFDNNALPELPREERAAVYAAMADTLAKLHALDIDALGLRDFGKTGDFFDRQLATWTRQHDALRLPNSDDFDRLIDWLRNNRPPMRDETTLIHGDYKLGNLMFHPSKPDVVALLDWELSTLGHPMADLGYNLLAWVQRSDELNGLADVDLAAAGIPTLDEHAAMYFEKRGLSGSVEPFFIAFSAFRLAVIFEGIVRREAQGAGTGTSDRLSSEDYARMFARYGLQLAGI